MARATAMDPTLRIVAGWVANGWPQRCPSRALQPYFRRRASITSLRGCLLYGDRVILPDSLLPVVRRLIHDLHVGIERCKAFCRLYFWFPTLDQVNTDTVNSCRANERAPPPRRISPHPGLPPRRGIGSTSISGRLMDGLFVSSWMPARGGLNVTGCLGKKPRRQSVCFDGHSAPTVSVFRSLLIMAPGLPPLSLSGFERIVVSNTCSPRRRIIRVRMGSPKSGCGLKPNTIGCRPIMAWIGWQTPLPASACCRGRMAVPPPFALWAVNHRPCWLSFVLRWRLLVPTSPLGSRRVTVYFRVYPLSRKGPKWADGTVARVHGNSVCDISTEQGIIRRHFSQMQLNKASGPHRPSPAPGVSSPDGSLLRSPVATPGRGHARGLKGCGVTDSPGRGGPPPVADPATSCRT